MIAASGAIAARASVPEATFNDEVARIFTAGFPRLFRFLNRLSGDADLAADLAQDAFVRLHARGSIPDQPDAWLITVALNQFRNTRTTGARRRRLMTTFRAQAVMADPPPAPNVALDDDDRRADVRRALERLPERDRHLLLLRAESYRYAEIARVLDLNEGSVGTLLARAKRAFLEASQQ
jgi:RNA polymerase sigma factor (sigma-70 family)